MLIQKMLWENTTEFGGREMFFRGPEADTDPAGRLVIPAAREVSFDTWFNLFSAVKWSRYTAVQKISLRVNLCGKGTLYLVGLSQKDPEQEKILRQKEYDCNAFQDIALLENEDVGDLEDFCFVRIRAKKETLLEKGEYLTEDSQGFGAEELRIACCICTYRREEFVRRNAETLVSQIMENPKSSLCDRIEVYISDNGRTLSGEKDLQHPLIHVYPNENYGGSAGFARTMIEAALYRKEFSFTHLILMDDDILLHPAVLERTAAFAGLLKKEYRKSILGGVLITLENRTIQAEGCGHYDIEAFGNRHTALEGLDLAKRENLLINETAEDANFSGWWYSCIPAELIGENNLPLPLFLHRDDQEFGLRCTEQGGKILQLNGIGVWHPSPSGKHEDYIAYYDMRNSLVVMQGHSEEALPAKRLKRLLLVKCIQNCLGYRYGTAMMTLQGCEDFCRGAAYFKELRPDVLHQELIAESKRQTIPVREIPEEALRRLSGERRISSAAKLVRYLFPSGECYAEAGCNYPSYLGCKRVIYLNAEKTVGYELSRSLKDTVRVMKRLFLTYRMINRGYAGACQEWRQEMEQLKTLQFWEQYINLR